MNYSFASRVDYRLMERHCKVMFLRVFCVERSGCRSLLKLSVKQIFSVCVRFFQDLENRHQKHPVIQDISDIIQNHASHHFEPYIIYCSNETFQQRTLQKLL